MALFGLADRVQETSVSTGTGNFTLAGALEGFRTFLSAVGDNSPCAYVIQIGSQWETGVGLVTSPNTLSRQTVLSSSNANALVNFAAGTKQVFISRVAAYEDADIAIAGENLAVRDVVFLALADSALTPGHVYKCTAENAAKSVDALVLGFCLHSATTGQAVLIKRSGVLGGFSLWDTGGISVYISNTAGEVAIIPPSNKRLVGVTVSDTELLINLYAGHDSFKSLVDTTPNGLGMIGPGIISNATSSSLSTLRSDVIDYLDLYSLVGNASIRGSVAIAVSSYAIVSSSTQVFLGGGASGLSSVVLQNAIQVASKGGASGNLVDTGDLTVARTGLAAVSGTNRGFFAGGKASGGESNVIDLLDFSTFTNATSDAGDLLVARSYLAGGSRVSINTGFFAGGFNTTFQSIVDKVDLSIGSQNATDRGDLTTARRSLAGVTGASFIFFAGGFNGSFLSDIEAVDHHTFSTVCLDRGDLTLARCSLGSSSRTNNAVYAGGNNGVELNLIENINTLAISIRVTDRGELSYARHSLGGDS